VCTLELNKVIEKLKSLQAKRILIQFPEGLKLRIQEISDGIERSGIETCLCLEHTFGACDVREDEAKRLNCDAILHIGHADFGVKTKMSVVYWDYFLDADPVPVLEKEFDKIKKYKNIGLVTSLQFVKTIPIVGQWLEKKGIQAYVAKSQQYPGQMLGCRVGAGKKIEQKVDVFLCISAGKFYGLGLALETEKPILNLDLEKQTIHEIESQKKKIQKIVAWNKQLLKEATRIGLLISWKKGQMFGKPFEDKKKLEDLGKKVYILAFDEWSNDKLEGLKLDILISYACPRIATDDLERTKIPLLNWDDLGQ